MNQNKFSSHCQFLIFFGDALTSKSLILWWWEIIRPVQELGNIWPMGNEGSLWCFWTFNFFFFLLQVEILFFNLLRVIRLCLTFCNRPASELNSTGGLRTGSGSQSKDMQIRFICNLIVVCMRMDGWISHFLCVCYKVVTCNFALPPRQIRHWIVQKWW